MRCRQFDGHKERDKEKIKKKSQQGEESKKIRKKILSLMDVICWHLGNWIHAYACNISSTQDCLPNFILQQWIEIDLNSSFFLSFRKHLLHCLSFFSWIKVTHKYWKHGVENGKQVVGTYGIAVLVKLKRDPVTTDKKVFDDLEYYCTYMGIFWATSDCLFTF